LFIKKRLNNVPAYKTQLISNQSKIQYLFESKGNIRIIKAIEYAPFKKQNGKIIYNLGFGDYDVANRTMLDDINSNNGDTRKVFSTVLNTVPLFFKTHKDDAIWVQGSDSSKRFKNDCKKICKKGCDTNTDVCKNFNRRIKIYRYYINKNFIDLIKEYVIFGYTNGKTPTFVQYVPENEYIGILVFKKK